MIIGGLGGCWVVMLDGRANLASIEAIFVVFGGLGGCRVVMHAHRAHLASV